MRTLSALLMVLLLCSLQQTCSGTEGFMEPGCSEDADNPVGCCDGVMSAKIPFKHIVDYRVTPCYCPRRAVVFMLIIRRNVCADPEAAWVKKYLKKLNARN